MVSGLARCSFVLRPAGSLTRFRAFCTKGFEHFITSMLASAATGWSVSCRVGFVLSHWSSAPFHGALKHALIASHKGFTSYTDFTRRYTFLKWSFRSARGGNRSIPFHFCRFCFSGEK